MRLFASLQVEWPWDGESCRFVEALLEDGMQVKSQVTGNGELSVPKLGNKASGVCSHICKGI